MAENKNERQKKITVAGVEYTLQKMLPRPWIQLKQRTTNKNGQPNDEKLYEEILEHVVVEPKVTLDDFEEFSHVDEVVAEAVRFQLGRSAQ